MCRLRTKLGGHGRRTAFALARVISQALHANRVDPTWMLWSVADRNPSVWMAQGNDEQVDLRDMPRKVQEFAFAKGMVPYIPADQE